jgi:hypothetical protein
MSHLRIPEETMKCTETCEYYKKNDAIKEMEDGVVWFCTMPHSQCEDMSCLMRMLIWEISHMNDILEED